MESSLSGDLIGFGATIGMKQAELIEMITHLAFYVGWPSAMSAANRAKALFEEKP